MSHDPLFTVRIHFSELVHGSVRSYSHDLEVRAFDFQEACEHALGEFETLAAHSNVGWIRSVDRMEIVRDDAAIRRRRGPPPGAGRTAD